MDYARFLQSTYELLEEALFAPPKLSPERQEVEDFLNRASDEETALLLRAFGYKIYHERGRGWASAHGARIIRAAEASKGHVEGWALDDLVQQFEAPVILTYIYANFGLEEERELTEDERQWTEADRRIKRAQEERAFDREDQS